MDREYQKQYKWATGVVNRKLAMPDLKTLLKNLFFDDNGNDEGGPLVKVDNLSASNRFCIHAESSGLFTETTVTEVLIIESRRID